MCHLISEKSAKVQCPRLGSSRLHLSLWDIMRLGEKPRLWFASQLLSKIHKRRPRFSACSRPHLHLEKLSRNKVNFKLNDFFLFLRLVIPCSTLFYIRNTRIAKPDWNRVLLWIFLFFFRPLKLRVIHPAEVYFVNLFQSAYTPVL